MMTKVLSQKLVLLVIGLAAGSGILVPTSFASFHPVTSSEIQDGTIQSVDIGTSQVKAEDIAADAVGASELQGVTKLLFGECVLTSAEATTVVPAGARKTIECSISGVDDNDNVVATLTNPSVVCFSVVGAITDPGKVSVTLWNHCVSPTAIGVGSTIGVIVFDK
jgi:hypothetical protein